MIGNYCFRITFFPLICLEFRRPKNSGGRYIKPNPSCIRRSPRSSKVFFGRKHHFCAKTFLATWALNVFTNCTLCTNLNVLMFMLCYFSQKFVKRETLKNITFINHKIGHFRIFNGPTKNTSVIIRVRIKRYLKTKL